MAASSESTTLTEIRKSEYSVAQSVSLAGNTLLIGAYAMVSSQPYTITPASAKADSISGKNRGAISVWISSVSAALQAAGYCTFESKAMSNAFFRAAAASTYT